MKKDFYAKCFGFIIFISIALYGCAPTSKITKLIGTWKYDQYTGGYLDKLMVVGKPRMDIYRPQYENYIAKALSKRKIEVIPSYTVIPEMDDLNKDSIKKAANESGVKAVLVTKVVGVDEQDVLFKQNVSHDYIATPYGMRMSPYMSGPRIVKSAKVRLETGLFEVESEKLIWAATSAIMNPDSADEAIKDFSAAIIQQLTTDGYIRPSKTDNLIKTLFY